MGVLFSTSGGKSVSDMAFSSAEMLILLTEAARLYYGFPNPVFRDLTKEQSECFVDEDEFCRLVELTFASPHAMLYPWAREAAGMYEVIKDEMYEWMWTPKEYPVIPFFPVRRKGYVPKKVSYEKIGKPWP